MIIHQKVSRFKNGGISKEFFELVQKLFIASLYGSKEFEHHLYYLVNSSDNTGADISFYRTDKESWRGAAVSIRVSSYRVMVSIKSDAGYILVEDEDETGFLKSKWRNEMYKIYKKFLLKKGNDALEQGVPDAMEILNQLLGAFKPKND